LLIIISKRRLKNMNSEKLYLDEDWGREIEEFLDERREIYALPDRLLFKHLMGCAIPGVN
jgi:hypothetical protein